MAEAAYQFPVSTAEKASDRLADAPESVRNRFKGLEAEDRITRAKQTARVDEISALGENITALTHQRHLSQSEVDKMGPYRKEVRTFDPTTNAETVAVENLPVIEKIDTQIATATATRKALANKKSRPLYSQRVLEDLGVSAPRPLIAAVPISWTPNKGEEIAPGYVREFSCLTALIKEEAAIWDAPRTVAEVIASVEKEIDLTVAIPGFGGHRRGHFIGDRGRQVSTPNKKIAWPMVRVGDHAEAVDSAGLMAWPFREQLKAAAREHILATYTDEGAISEADKPALLADLMKKVWHQRRICEAAYLYARANGVTNLNRPRETATEILLDVLPFDKSRARTLADIAAPAEIEADPSLDFEGDAND
jgi:hypothetical protein